MIDITGAGAVEVRVRGDGKVVWVNIDEECMFRVCQIEGPIIVEDERDQEPTVEGVG